MNKMLDQQLQLIKRFVVRGFLFLIPFAITIFVIKTVLQISDGIVVPIATAMLRLYLPNSAVTTDFIAPGVSFVVLMVLVIAVGAIASWKVGHQGLRLIDHLFFLIPGVRKIHAAGRKVMDMLGDENSTAAFKRVVFVQLNNSDILSIAFVTGEVKDSVTGTRYLSIIIPLPPNPVTGLSAFVKEEQVIDSGLSIEDGVQYVMSFGVLNFKELPLSKNKGV